MNYTLHCGDCLDILRTLPDNSVDAVVTDPPYGLSFMGKKWDYDVPSEDVWRECLRVLKPGGHLLAFAGTRTQHRMAVRIEDAGFEIRDMIAWVYGSGFPKSLDVSKAIDKAAGAEREVVGKKSRTYGDNPASGGNGSYGNTIHGIFIDRRTDHERMAITAPATDAARQWQGWGTALKPALEPITVARKPLIGTVAENVLAWGTGGVNVDGCRVGTTDTYSYPNGPGGKSHHYSSDKRSSEVRPNATESNPLGRWPANLIHDGSEEVVGLFPDKAGAFAPVRSGHSGKSRGIYGDYEQRGDDGQTFYADSGSAARFFYCAKASKADRDEGCEGLEEKHRILSNQAKAELKRGNTDYKEDLGKLQMGGRIPSRNAHPTVKPTDLMRYLCRLVTPPGGIVLDPFMGSGSTGKAAILEDFAFIGIEREAEYLDIARARIEYVVAPDFEQTAEQRNAPNDQSQQLTLW